MSSGCSNGGGGEGMLAALHAAASKGRVEQARALLQANPLLATTRDAQGWTPALLAAYYDQPEVLEMCLAKGAKANDVDTDTYRAACLHWAAGHGRVGLVLSLVTQHGADPNLKVWGGAAVGMRVCLRVG
jgi:ankyrin repeat protein